jgi:hypothetical protein
MDIISAEDPSTSKFDSVMICLSVVTFLLLTPVLVIFALASWLLRGEGVLATGMGKL